MRPGDYLQQLIQWQKMLTDLQQENAVLKIKLSELVDNSVMTDFLHQAENMHNELIANDTSIDVLLDSVNQISDSMKPDEQRISEGWVERIKSLAKDIRKFQERFLRLSARVTNGLLVN